MSHFYKRELLPNAFIERDRFTSDSGTMQETPQYIEDVSHGYSIRTRYPISYERHRIPEPPLPDHLITGPQDNHEQTQSHSRRGNDLDFNPVYSNLRDAYDPIGWVRLPRSIGEAQRHYPIIFSSQHGGWMPWLGDILHNRDHLVGANEEVFRWRSGPLHTIMVLDWPGYPCTRIGERFPVDDKYGSVTRIELAKLIAIRVKGFMDSARNHPEECLQEPGYERWTVNQSVKFSDVRLIGLDIYDNVWVPEFWVVA